MNKPLAPANSITSRLDYIHKDLEVLEADNIMVRKIYDIFLPFRIIYHLALVEVTVRVTYIAYSYNSTNDHRRNLMSHHNSCKYIVVVEHMQAAALVASAVAVHIAYSYDNINDH